MEQPKLINIVVENKIAKNPYPDQQKIINGNTGYFIHFDFDEEWDGYAAKTAVFIWNDEYREETFTGNEVEVPVLSNTNFLEVGVYSGNLKTTTKATVYAKKCVLCGLGKQHEPPEEDVYNQIIELFNTSTESAKAYAGKAEESAGVASDNADEAVASAKAAKESEKASKESKNAAAQSANDSLENAGVSAASAKLAKDSENNAAKSAEASKESENKAAEAEKKASEYKELVANEGAKQITAIQTEGNTQVERVQSEGASYQRQLDELNKLKIINTASGELAHVEDSADWQMQYLAIYGKYTQDGEPSPDNPVEPEFVGDKGDVKVMVHGKNLCPPLTFGLRISSTNGQYMEDENSASTKLIPISFTNNEQYYIGELLDTINSFISAYDENKNFITRTNGILRKNASLPKELSNKDSLDKIKYIALCQYVLPNNPGVIDDAKNIQIQLELGTTATPYEPYQEQTITIPLAEPLMGSDNVRNSISRNGNFKPIKRKVFNGSEKWELNTKKKYFSTVLNDKKTYNVNDSMGSILCDSYEYNTLTWSDDTVQYGFVCNNKNLCIRNNDFETVEEFKALLAEKPITVYYELDEPVLEPLTAEQQAVFDNLPSMYYPVTNIINDENAEMEVKYICDTKNYIDSKLAEITALALEV